MTEKNSTTYPSTETISHYVHQSVDFHCHGIGPYDFTDIEKLNLDHIEHLLRERGVSSILTLYLFEDSFSAFLEKIDEFHQGKLKGKYKHIKGFGLEGPLLASPGGTPFECVWFPSEKNWQQLAECGEKGLTYVILSPDFFLNESPFAHETTSPPMNWIARTLLRGGVLATPGHFTKTNPLKSAHALQSMFDAVKEWGRGFTITDHLYNDMPLNFKHAWRSPDEKARREEDILNLGLETWTVDNLSEKLGPVPATILKNAKEGLVKICINFDGEHVDLVVIKRTIDLIGANNFMMMTDSIESKKLAGRNLTMQHHSTLLYQAQGVVAAGSQKAMKQIQNMFEMGLTEEQVKQIVHIVPNMVFEQLEKFHQNRG